MNKVPKYKSYTELKCKKVYNTPLMCRFLTRTG